MVTYITVLNWGNSRAWKLENTCNVLYRIKMLYYQLSKKLYESSKVLEKWGSHIRDKSAIPFIKPLDIAFARINMKYGNKVPTATILESQAVYLAIHWNVNTALERRDMARRSYAAWTARRDSNFCDIWTLARIRDRKRKNAFVYG